MKSLLALVLVGVAAWGVEVPNGDFSAGEGEQPASWQLAESVGGWYRDGERPGVYVRGDGSNMGYWRSATLPFEPGKVYRVEFLARSPGGGGGTAVTGPVFCNMDIGVPPAEWRRYRGVFLAPHHLTEDSAWLRFGQWHVSGEVVFADVSLEEVQPVHRRLGDVVLGTGESVAGTQYRFRAPLGGEGRNYARPLAHAACGFNSNRWTFGADSEVVYAHRVGERSQTAGSVEVTVGYYRGGRLVVEASADGKPWREVATLAEQGSVQAELPADLYPATEIRIRLRAQASQRVGAAQSDPGSFQVHGFEYAATLREGIEPGFEGGTRYVAVESVHPALAVSFRDFGAGIPGGANEIRVAVANPGAAVEAVASVAFRREGEPELRPAASQVFRLNPGATELALPYEIPGTGAWELFFTLASGATFQARTDLYVPVFYAFDYGELVPGSTAEVALWRASSGWKVPRLRPAPTAHAEAVELALARNEAEAVQLVLRPARDLRGLTVAAGALLGPGRAALPASAVEVLRVGYVPVTLPTDRTGLAADWPDPLPPLVEPLDVAAGQNQPLWIRVKTPAEAIPGLYRGTLDLRAEGWAATVPLAVEVFDFALPNRMTCETAFGFSPGMVFRYQKVNDPAQRREVLAKYWRNFGDHHISPYNPAPLDPFVVTWPQQGDWTGGTIDRTDKVAGEASLLVNDTSETAGASARFGELVRIPRAGFRLRFHYRTLEPGHAFLVTFNHHDGNRTWMSGRNHDMRLVGDGTWQSVDRVVDRFPEGAEFIAITLWATLYADDGHHTGGVRYDDFELTDLDTGKVVAKGEFEPMAPETLQPVFDWTAWDRAVAEGIGTYGFNTFRMPIQGMGGGTFHARYEPTLLGYAEGTPEYEAAFSRYVGAIEGHLRDKGWLREAFVYWFDEPDPKDYEFVMNGFRKLKQHAPGLRRMLTEQVEEELIGGPNLWCPVSSSFQEDAAPLRRAAGERFWWYVCTGPKAPYCTLFIDHPGTEMRVWLWQTWEREIDGILVWESNYWTSSAAYPDQPQNPYEDPMGWVSGYSTPKGSKRPWGNGDGRFIYPPVAAADGNPPGPVLEGPVDSIRWEMLRDGIEDYEYFAMLKRLLAERGDRLPAARREAYAALLEVPDTVSVSLTEFTTDPAPLEAHRRRLAAAIAALLK